LCLVLIIWAQVAQAIPNAIEYGSKNSSNSPTNSSNSPTNEFDTPPNRQAYILIDTATQFHKSIAYFLTQATNGAPEGSTDIFVDTSAAF
jgi:hypothetical protein